MTHTDEFEGNPELVKKRARSLAVRNIAIALLLIYMLFTSAITTINAIQGAQTRHQIIDCVQPGNKCFTDSQKRTGEVVQSIVDEITTTREVSILAAACSTDPVLDSLTRGERIAAIDLCVQAALRNKQLRRDENK